MAKTFYKATPEEKATTQAAVNDALPSSAQVPMGTEPEEEKEEGFEVNDPVEVDSLTDQESGILPAATKVLFNVKKAALKIVLIDNKIGEGERLDATTLEVNKWTAKQLHLELQVGSEGIDGTGAYANKVLFRDLYLKVNMPALKEAHERRTLTNQIKGQTTKPFNETWWAKESRYDTKMFYLALGIDIANPPVANDDFFIQLIGCQVLADITRVKDDYKGQGEFKNEVKNFRSV
jgi:hypothetical protein